MKVLIVTIVGSLILAGCATSHDISTQEHANPVPPSSPVTNAQASARAVAGLGQTKAGNFPCTLQPTADGLYMQQSATERRRRIPWESCVTLRRWGDVLVIQFPKDKAPDFADWRSHTGLLGFSFRSADNAGIDYLAEWFARYSRAETTNARRP